MTTDQSFYYSPVDLPQYKLNNELLLFLWRNFRGGKQYQPNDEINRIELKSLSQI